IAREEAVLAPSTGSFGALDVDRDDRTRPDEPVVDLGPLALRGRLLDVLHHLTRDADGVVASFRAPDEDGIAAQQPQRHLTGVDRPERAMRRGGRNAVRLRRRLSLGRRDRAVAGVAVPEDRHPLPPRLCGTGTTLRIGGSDQAALPRSRDGAGAACRTEPTARAAATLAPVPPHPQP